MGAHPHPSLARNLFRLPLRQRRQPRVIIAPCPRLVLREELRVDGAGDQRVAALRATREPASGPKLRGSTKEIGSPKGSN